MSKILRENHLIDPFVSNSLIFGCQVHLRVNNWRNKLIRKKKTTDCNLLEKQRPLKILY